MSKPNLIPPAHIEQKSALFWSKVAIGSSDECWEWQSTRRNNYGYFHTRTRRDGKRVSRRDGAHRIAYFLTYHIWPGTNDVCHRCDNPPCCNPNHLFNGSRTDNMNDAYSKHRMPITRGSQRTSAKLNEESVCLIRDLHKQGHTYAKLAQQFSVCEGSIQQVIHRTRWKHC